MAKLSARGRTTLVAVIKEWKNPHLPRLSQEGDSYMVEYEWQTVKRRFMSDGNVLEWVKWKHHKHVKPFIQNWKLMRKYPIENAIVWLDIKLNNGWKKDTKV